MDPATFNQAREEIGLLLIRAQTFPTPENMSQLMLKMAQLGLVAVPFEHYPDTIPQPLCAMVYLPSGKPGERQSIPNTYLVPVNQRLPS